MHKLKNFTGILFFLGVVMILYMIIVPEYHLADKKPTRIVCITKNIDENNGFWESVMEGAKMAADEYSVELTIFGPKKEDDYITQNMIIEDAIKTKPDAIVLAASDYHKTNEAAKKIVDHNIKLIMIDSDISEDLATTTISTDNLKAGIKMGALMKTILTKDSEIGIISHVKNTSTAIDREKGVRIGLNDAQDRIVDTYYCGSDYQKAIDGTKAMLKKYKDITVLAGLNQYASLGAAQAVKELGLEKQIKIVGFDNAISQIKYLEEGIFQGIVVQQSFKMGYLGIEYAVKILKGESVPRNIDSGATLITKENMYTKMNQKLLFPFIKDE